MKKLYSLILISCISASTLFGQCEDVMPAAIWPNINTQSISIATDIPQDFIDRLQDGMTEWNTRPEKHWPTLNRGYQYVSSYSPYSCDGKNTLIFGYPSNQEAGAKVYKSTAGCTPTAPGQSFTIVGADIMINRDSYIYGYYYTGTRLGIVPNNKYDFLTIITHELGHFLGLSDTDNLSCKALLMYGKIDQGKRRSIQEYEAAILRNRYLLK